MRRRTLLLAGAGSAGAMLVGWGLLPPRSRLGEPRLPRPPEGGSVALNGWIRIAPDGSVQLAMPRSEMGQGVHTALAMLVAEELALPLGRVALVEAGHEAIYGNVAVLLGNVPVHPRDDEPGREAAGVRAARWVVAKLARELGLNVTGGSSSIADAWEVLPLAAATARARLVGAASLQWKLPAAELVVEGGVVRHPGSGHAAHYGELAAQAAATPPGEVRLKPRADWALVGRAVPRSDLPDKVDGSAVFGLDVRLPGMLYAALRMPPQLGGSPGRVDADALLRQPGVERLVRLPSYAGAPPALAVVARSHWHAQQAARALAVDWHAPVPPAPDSARILAALEAEARDVDRHGGGVPFHRRGDAAAALAGAARRLEALYRAPYLAHAAMEPQNCTARMAGGRVELWVPTQVPGFARALAAQVAGVREADVTVHVTLLGGGFGRRLETDVVGQAVRIALECGGRPVQLLWSREDDFAHDVFRPAGVALLRAGLDAQQRPVALSIAAAGDAVTPRWLARNVPWLATPFDAPDKTAAEGLFDLPYDIAHQRIAHRATHSGVPVGNWRSVGHSHHAFFSEGFVDEMAQAAGADPLAFRLGLLATMPRHAAVLRLAAAKAGWGTPAPRGTARGLALHESYGSIVAIVAEVRDDGGRPQPTRLVIAADVGTVVHPGIVAQQFEGAALFGLAAALHGRIDIVDGVVRQANFPAYPLVTLARTPRVELHLVPSERPPAGVGEPGVPPVAPAVANAWAALTGRRWRTLPLDGAEEG